MKKILFFLLLLFCIPFSIFGINGAGTFASPYNGPLTTNMTWSGTVYVNGDVTVDGFTLTISPGAIIVFLASGTDIIITGSGVLTASGSAGNMIRFTADFNNNGIYGEAGEKWGHISFQNMTPGFTTPSIINYCIIEFGQKNSSPFNFESAGGGIQTTYSFLTISNSTIRNNYAGYGGGIYVNANASPTISNCIISSNLAGTTGGGISLFQNSAATLTNCIIEKNTVTGGGGGGGLFIGDYPDNVRIYNCVVASNVSTGSPGNNIRIWKSAASTGPRLYNTIVWGSGNSSINYLQLGPSATDFNYCAIQGYTSGYTNCINLSGTNNDPTGPNFYNVTPGSEDYQIIFNSPCRDAGTSTGAPSTDILGKFRVGLPDIGAYEVQYSNWTGVFNTDWTNQSNWEASLDPGSGSGDVVIPFLSGATPNYPIGTPAPNFIIGTGKTMILRPGAEATFGALTNNGTLRLESDVTGISSLIVSTYSGNNADVQLYLPGGGLYPSYVWHYISSPFTALPTSFFTGTLDLARYDESLITTDQNNGWVAVDGWVYLPTGHYGGTGFSNLDVGQGYNHYLSSNHTYIISGTFNTDNVTDNLAYNSINSTTDYPNAQGFNLLGNPFPSCLDWTQISGSLDPSISQAIYFNKSGGFASWSNGIGTNGGTGTIPPMQGFFVKAYAKNLSVFLPSSARVHSATQTRYKKGLEIIPLVRLKIEDPLNSDDAVVRFDDKATTGVDNAFDAYKFSKSGLSIWTSTGGVDFSINGLPFPAPGVEIPVSVSSTAAENLKISASQIDGLDNYNVTLTDNVNNITIDLKTNPSLSFNAPGGIVAGRFTLKVLTVTTAVPETTISDKPFNIYSSNGMLNIQTLNDTWNGKQGGIKILDMTGRVLTTEDNVEFSKDDLLQVPFRVATGIYMVEMRSGVTRYVGKVVIR
jgi:hypothetical protein